MYAEDTCVRVASESLNQLLTALKNELGNISNWMRINKLSYKSNKSEHMVIGHRGKLNNVGVILPDLVHNQVIKRVNKAKIYGD